MNLIDTIKEMPMKALTRCLFFLIFNYLFKFNFRYFIKLIVFKNISVCVVWNRYNANTTLRSEFEFEFDPQNIVLRGTKANPREYVTEKLFHVNVCFPFF